MMYTQVIDGVLTVCVPLQHECVYREEGMICIRLGATQEEAAKALEGLDAALGELPVNATQVMEAAAAFKELDAQTTVKPLDMTVINAALAADRERRATEAAALAAAAEPVKK